MKIMEKLEHFHTAITAGDLSLAKLLQDEAVAAMLGGIGSTDWEKFMRHFHSNCDQLKRLMGQDTTFMNDPNRWGARILAYVLSGGPCGGGTNFSMVVEDMHYMLKDSLDYGISSTTVPGKDGCDPEPIPTAVSEYLKRT